MSKEIKTGIQKGDLVLLNERLRLVLFIDKDAEQVMVDGSMWYYVRDVKKVFRFNPEKQTVEEINDEI